MKMSPELYYECWREAEEWAGPLVSASVPVGLVLSRVKWSAVSTAVYMAVSRAGHICYVGSVRRESLSGLAGRMRGHEATTRYRLWQALHIVPLIDGTPIEVVRSIEGRVGRLLLPSGNFRLPKVH
jgi:hypothetical protein